MSDDERDAKLYPFTPPPPRPGRATPRKPRSSRLTKSAVGLAVIIGAGAGGAVVASATNSGPPSSPAAASASASTTTPSKLPGPGRRGFFYPAGPGGFARAGRLGALGVGIGPDGAIHGSFTVKAPDGRYETIDTQYGTATAVSNTSITVKSADGFSQTYTVGSSTIVNADYDGINSVKVGDTIRIQGLVTDSTVTAERVLDLTQIQANGQSWVPHPSATGRPGFPPGGPGSPGGPGGSGGSGGSAA